MPTPHALFDLTGKVALITGGSRGLGREMALAFADAGADVIVSSRKADACEAVAAEVRAKGRRAAALAAHAGKWDEMDRLADAAWAEFGRLDILVANAGMGPLVPSHEVSEALFDSVVSLNFKGPFRLMANVADRMATARRRHDPRHLVDRGTPPDPAGRAICGRQGRAQRDRRQPGARIRPEGARQRHRRRPFPHRYFQSLERGSARNVGQRASPPGPPRRDRDDRALSRQPRLQLRHRHDRALRRRLLSPRRRARPLAMRRPTA